MNKLPNELTAEGRYSTITMFNDRGSTKYMQAYNKGDNLFSFDYDVNTKELSVKCGEKIVQLDAFQTEMFIRHLQQTS